MRCPSSRLVALCLLVGLPGCTTRLGAAVDAWRDGRAPEAAATLRALEHGARREGPRILSRYALYRGLVELTLGNAGAADRWLRFAEASRARDPALFDERERGQLAAAWRSMGHMPGDVR